MPKHDRLPGNACDRKNKDEIAARYREWAPTCDDGLKNNSYVAPDLGARVFAAHVHERAARMVEIGF